MEKEKWHLPPSGRVNGLPLASGEQTFGFGQVVAQ
jgi:hypothetical protein